MYIIVVGGGKIGYYLTKTLVNEGREVLLIEKDSKKVATYEERFGSVVVQGDGCEAATLEAAGAARADVLVAVTGDDEDNLVACQIAKAHYNVRRTICRVNNPKNERIIKDLGVDVTVDATNLMKDLIEQYIPERHMVHLLTMRHADLAIVEGRVTAGSPVLGKVISDVRFPARTVISAIVRQSQLLVASGSTRFEEGDEVIAISHREQEGELQTLFTGEQIVQI